MRITKVICGYSELRTGSPEFGNKRYAINYEAEVDESENYRACRCHLMEKAIHDVKLLHGDNIQDVKLTVVTVAKQQPF